MARSMPSIAARRFRGFFEQKARSGEGNVAWVARAVNELEERGPEGDGDVGDPTYLLLTGGRGATSFRLRVAQSHLRHDLSPSHWSCVSLIHSDPPVQDDTALVEVSLEPLFGFNPAANGIQGTFLDQYGDPAATPNLAVLRVPVPRSRWRQKATPTSIPLLEQLAKQRGVIDLQSILTSWLAFVWSTPEGSNPLLDDVGIPAGIAVEALVSAAGYDLCPGLDSRAACPESIWQTARWWHPYYQDQGIPPVRGAWTIRHRIDVGKTPGTAAGQDRQPPDLGL